MRLDAFMDWALTDPEQGYYATRNAFGRDGDFITAPDVSQIFGELIALWVVDRWAAMGRPNDWQLIELGPGRLTLIQDVRRVLAGRCAMPAITLVDVRTHEGFTTVGSIDQLRFDRPFVILANEFFDALPIRQVLLREGRLVERFVDSQSGALVWRFLPAETGATLGEISPVSRTIARTLAAQIAGQPAALLAIDYGGEGQLESFQALKRHKPVDPLVAPGEADLTAHVDFSALSAAAAPHCAVYGPSGQGAFLSALGGAQRLGQLQAANPARAEELAAGYQRLSSPTEMGKLFKALCFQTAGLTPPPGFAEINHGI